MKALVLGFLVLAISAETFAQDRRGPRGGVGHGAVHDRPGVDDGRPGRGGDAPRDHRAPSRNDRYDSRDPYDRRDDNYYRGPRREADYNPYRDNYYNPGRGGVVIGGGVVIVGPRYTPNRNSRRYVRTYRRDPMVWTYGFGYQCGMYGDLLLNGRLVHNFTFSSDCYQALEDIRIYGDFCDREDLYDQSGILEAQFTFSYECREALGWYY